MKQVMISHLKARLSSYLAMVMKGEDLVVLDRRNPVARIVPYDGPQSGLSLIERSRPASELRSIRPVSLGRVIDVVGLLREDRDQR